MTISNYTSLQEHFKFENSISQYIDDIKISNKTKLDKNFFFSKQKILNINDKINISMFMTIIKPSFYVKVL